MRDYLKFLKRGYGRTAHLTSLDIRNGRTTREEALKLTSEYDGKRPASLELFLKYVGIDEEDFMDIAMTHMVSPWKPDVFKIQLGKPLPDMERWDRTTELIEK